MVFKILKPSGKDVEERESLACKKKSRVLNSDKKSKGKLSGEPPSSLGAFRYFGKNIDDPQVKLKLFELTPRNPAQQTSAGVQEFVKHMTSIIREKKYSFRIEAQQGDGRYSGKDEERLKDKNLEKLMRNTDGSGSKSSLEKTKSEKVDISKKHLENKFKMSRSEVGEKKTESKILSGSPERKKTDVQTAASEGKEEKSSPQANCPESPRQETAKSQAGVKPENEKRMRRSEIPLLKNRPLLDKRTQVVSLLMKKSLQENESTTSINFYPNNKCHPVDEYKSSELEIILRPSRSSSKLTDTGRVINLESSKRGRSESLPHSPAICLKSSAVNSEKSDCSATEKKTPRGSRAKTLDLEKVKSSFTILRTESDTFSRLESFHKQNITAKENARAEIAIRASKLLVMTSKTSFSSIKSKKNIPASVDAKAYKPNLKKPKKTKNEPRDHTPSKKSPKKSETPHLDICREIMATGKVGCLIPKKVAKEKETKKGKSEGKGGGGATTKPITKPAAKPVTKPAAKSVTKPAAKPVTKPVTNPVPKEQSKVTQSNKVYTRNEKVEKAPQKPEQGAKVNPPPVAAVAAAASNVVVEVPAKSETVPTKNNPQNVAGPETNLTARELASLVVTGTALNFEEIFEKPPEVDKIKLEIKIDVPSEEDGTDSEVVECESSGDVSRTSIDWLLMSKVQGSERQAEEKVVALDEKDKEKLSSWDLFSEELIKPGEPKWQPSEAVFQEPLRNFPPIRRRPNFKTTVININAMDKSAESELGDRWPLSGELFNCPKSFQNEGKPDTKVRSGLTRSSNREEKIFDDPTALKLRRRNSEPYSFRGFIWKRAEASSPKSLKPSVSSMASSLRHLNNDEIDDFIFWEAVPQKLTSCWEMSLYHFKRPWSVLSCSVFRDNRRSNTPGLILDTLRSGGVANMRRPLLYQNDRITRHKGNIFDVEPSISQKNIDIRNWLAALNFTAPVSNTSDVINEGTFLPPTVMETQKQTTLKRRNVVPPFRLPDKGSEKKSSHKEKLQRLDKWNISDMDELKELIRRESGSYVTKEQYILSELSNPRSTVIASACTYSTPPEVPLLATTGDQDMEKEKMSIESVERSCQSEPPEGEDVALEKRERESSDSAPEPPVGTFMNETVVCPPEVNIWKYLFLFTLMFIIFHYSLGSNSASRS